MYVCPQCNKEIGEHETLCPHCSQNISPLSIVPAQKQRGDKRVWIEFILGFLSAFLFSCALPMFLIGVIISLVIGIIFLLLRPALSNGVMLGALVGVLGAFYVCTHPPH